jgi:hypothetical protein
MIMGFKFNVFNCIEFEMNMLNMNRNRISNVYQNKTGANKIFLRIWANHAQNAIFISLGSLDNTNQHRFHAKTASM